MGSALFFSLFLCYAFIYPIPPFCLLHFFKRKLTVPKAFEVFFVPKYCENKEHTQHYLAPVARPLLCHKSQLTWLLEEQDQEGGGTNQK
jgi:hypothetical protein